METWLFCDRQPERLTLRGQVWHSILLFLES